MTVTFLNKESLTTKRTLTFIGLTAVCSGYILFLAILAPQQLAEATTAATNVVCNGCVSTTDIADGTIQSRDIRDGQVTTSDIGTGQVRNVDIGPGQVTSDKISDINGVNSEDIVDGEITAADIDDDTIQPNVQVVSGTIVTVQPGEPGLASVDCPDGTVLTGGGYLGHPNIQVYDSLPIDANTWAADGFGENGGGGLQAYAVCMEPMP
jgi:hypothetical protein